MGALNLAKHSAFLPWRPALRLHPAPGPQQLFGGHAAGAAAATCARPRPRRPAAATREEERPTSIPRRSNRDVAAGGGPPPSSPPFFSPFAPHQTPCLSPFHADARATAPAAPAGAAVGRALAALHGCPKCSPPALRFGVHVSGLQRVPLRVHYPHAALPSGLYLARNRSAPLPLPPPPPCPCQSRRCQPFTGALRGHAGGKRAGQAKRGPKEKRKRSPSSPRGTLSACVPCGPGPSFARAFSLGVRCGRSARSGRVQCSVDRLPRLLERNEGGETSTGPRCLFFFLFFFPVALALLSFPAHSRCRPFFSPVADIMLSSTHKIKKENPDALEESVAQVRRRCASTWTPFFLFFGSCGADGCLPRARLGPLRAPAQLGEARAVPPRG